MTLLVPFVLSGISYLTKFYILPNVWGCFYFGPLKLNFFLFFKIIFVSFSKRSTLGDFFFFFFLFVHQNIKYWDVGICIVNVLVSYIFKTNMFAKVQTKGFFFFFSCSFHFSFNGSWRQLKGLFLKKESNLVD